MFSRRSLLKGLLPAALLPGASAQVHPTEPVEPPSTLDGLNSICQEHPQYSMQVWLRGVPVWFTFRFTGFKSGRADTLLVAQWLAHPSPHTHKVLLEVSRSEWLDVPSFFSSTPGARGAYWPGYTFDIAPRPGQVYLRTEDLALSPKALLAKAEAASRQAHNRLIDLLHTWDGKVDFQD